MIKPLLRIPSRTERQSDMALHIKHFVLGEMGRFHNLPQAIWFSWFDPLSDPTPERIEKTRWHVDLTVKDLLLWKCHARESGLIAKPTGMLSALPLVLRIVVLYVLLALP